MNPDFIYFKEIPFGEHNKFTLDFSNKKFVQWLSFLKNQDYYISSLNCNLILKESKQFNYKDKKKEIEELSQKSRLLLEKGAAYQNDIGWMNSAITGYFNFPLFGLIYNFIPYPKTIDENSYKYKFYDTVEKKLEIVKLVHHFHIIKETDLNLKE